MEEKTRKRKLPEGWYPETEKEVLTMIEGWGGDKPEVEGRSAVVPHAGWYFSGKLACRTIKALKKNIDTVVVAGGHLARYDSVLLADEKYFETPLGNIENCSELHDILEKKSYVDTDSYQDNTVEIQLPFVKNHFSEINMLWIRVPPEYEKVKMISEILKNYETKYNKKVSVIGSTDLTHYGISYGMTSHGYGKAGLDWVKNVNDSKFIEYLKNFEIEKAVMHSISEHSACSSGGAALSARFALDSGCMNSMLKGYYTSYDIYPSDSFVGYAGIIYY